MPAARPIWKGQIRLSLVAIPVELYSASKTGARLSFRQIYKPSGKPIKLDKVVPGVDPVDADEIMKGFEYEKDNFVLLTCSTGMMLETLHHEDEIRKSDPFFSSIPKAKADKELLGVASELIARKTAAFDAAQFKDHDRQALREVIDKKLKSRGKKTVATKEEAPSRGDSGNVIDLMDALKSSLEKSGRKSATTSGGKTSASRKKAS